jgi:hypothetical protein
MRSSGGGRVAAKPVLSSTSSASAVHASCAGERRDPRPRSPCGKTADGEDEEDRIGTAIVHDGAHRAVEAPTASPSYLRHLPHLRFTSAAHVNGAIHGHDILVAKPRMGKMRKMGTASAVVRGSTHQAVAASRRRQARLVFDIFRICGSSGRTPAQKDAGPRHLSGEARKISEDLPVSACQTMSPLAVWGSLSS